MARTRFLHFHRTELLARTVCPRGSYPEDFSRRGLKWVRADWSSGSPDRLSSSVHTPLQLWPFLMSGAHTHCLKNTGACIFRGPTKLSVLFRQHNFPAVSVLLGNWRLCHAFVNECHQCKCPPNCLVSLGDKQEPDIVSIMK